MRKNILKQLTFFAVAGALIFSAGFVYADNLIPTITGISPTEATVGDAPFNFIVSGSDFVEGAIIAFDGLALPTDFTSSTQVQLSSPFDPTSAGQYSVTVTNPAPGGGTSNAVDFSVNADTSGSPLFVPDPTITFIEPNAAQENSGDTPITVNGTNFITGTSVIYFSTTPLATDTALASSGQLTAVIPTSLLTTAGTFGVYVSNGDISDPNLNSDPTPFYVGYAQGTLKIHIISTPVSGSFDVNISYANTGTSVDSRTITTVPNPVDGSSNYTYEVLMDAHPDGAGIWMGIPLGWYPGGEAGGNCKLDNGSGDI